MDFIAIKNITLYKSLDIMPIGNFDMVLKGEYSFLVEGHKRHSKPKKITKEFAEAWDKLYNKFCELTENNDSLMLYVLEAEILYLQEKLLYVPILIEQLCQAIHYVRVFVPQVILFIRVIA